MPSAVAKKVRTCDGILCCEYEIRLGQCQCQCQSLMMMMDVSSLELCSVSRCGCKMQDGTNLQESRIQNQILNAKLLPSTK
jgi:hypothetical protein